MKVLGLFLLFTGSTAVAATTVTPNTTTGEHRRRMAQGQSNLNTVCLSVVNTLDCSQFDPKPICATNGVQYSSECDFAKAHCVDAALKVVSEGPCASATTAAPVVTTAAPVATAAPTSAPTGPGVTATIPPDVVSTNNPVTSQPMDTTMASVMTTTDPNLSVVCNAVVNTPCGAAGTAICATNGNTYANYCEFSKGRCYYPGLALAYDGPCSTTDTFATFTSPVYSTLPPSVFDIICRTLEQVVCDTIGTPVCASDGAVYNTGCDYEKAKCLDRTLSIINC